MRKPLASDGTRADPEPARIEFHYTGKSHLVSRYQVDAMRRAFEANGSRVKELNRTAAGLRLSQALKKLRLIRNIRQIGNVRAVVPVPRLAEGDCFPTCLYREIVPWSYDCWPNEYDHWARFFRRTNVRLAFISQERSAARLAELVPNVRFEWLPEATDMEEYANDIPLAERSIHILELGRRHEACHEALLRLSRELGLRHLFEIRKGEIVFPGRDGLRRGLADSLVSVCFPKTVTHPCRAGGIETVTHRYFESLASGCIVVGHAPRELVRLFGYNPVVEADAQTIAARVGEIARDPQGFEDLRNRNYERMKQVGTWSVRARDMIRRIRRFYEEPAGELEPCPTSLAERAGFSDFTHTP